MSGNRGDCFQELMLMLSTKMNSAMIQQRNPSAMLNQEPLLQGKICESPDFNVFTTPVSGISLVDGSLQKPINSDSKAVESFGIGLGSHVGDNVNGDKSSLGKSVKLVTSGQELNNLSCSTSSSVIEADNANEASNQVKKGFICSLKEGFGFIETETLDGEVFFHSSALEGEFSSLELGQEVEYIIKSSKVPIYGRNAAEMVKPLPKGSIGCPPVFPQILQGVVTRPLRGSNSDQVEYSGYIEGSDGYGYKYGIISIYNKKEALHCGEVVDFQINAKGNIVNIRANRKKFRATVESVKGQYGFLSYELDEGKKLFFHVSDVKDHEQLNPGDEVEFVILQSPRSGKSSACCIVKLGLSQSHRVSQSHSPRPERLLSRVTKLSLDENAKRVVVIRQPWGPDGTKGFTYRRVPRTPGVMTS